MLTLWSRVSGFLYFIDNHILWNLMLFTNNGNIAEGRLLRAINWLSEIRTRIWNEKIWPRFSEEEKYKRIHGVDK